VLDSLLEPSLAVLGLAVFIDQVGLPVPALPVLVLAGAAVAHGRLSLPTALAVAAAAGTVADLIWYAAGRRLGGRVLGTLCRLSLSPDGCVRQAETLFERRGLSILLVAKFIPGVAAVSTAMAGTTRAPLGRFVLFDAAGALLWTGLLLGTGVVFSDAVRSVIDTVLDWGRVGLIVVAALVAAWIGLRAWRRYLVLRALRMTRIDVDELHRLLETGAAPVVLDVRSALRQSGDGRIPGALSLASLDADLAHLGPPGDRDVIVYCACPNEASAVTVAQRLRAAGFTRVRPLAGGIDAWRDAGYRLEFVDPGAVNTAAGG
jgi:membrane protein DedA with SNARE-associated domain/rhodanese-related sulfurtransferase